VSAEIDRAESEGRGAALRGCAPPHRSPVARQG
jgi:hypothetical protein